MNEYFREILDSDWLTQKDRDDFANYCFIFSHTISNHYGEFDWGNGAFCNFCKKNRIQQKGVQTKKIQDNHFWFEATKPKGEKINDTAFHFFRHIRNAFAHGYITIFYKGRKRHRYYKFQDWNKKIDRKTQETIREQSMGGCIRSDYFWQMLWLLYQSKQN